MDNIEDMEKFVLNICDFPDTEMRQMVLTTDQLEYSSKLVIDEEFLNQKLSNLKNFKPSMFQKFENMPFIKYVQNHFAQIEIGMKVEKQSKDDLQEKIENWEDNGHSFDFLYTQVNIKPDQNLQNFILNQDNINKQQDEQQRHKLMNDQLQIMKQMWELYPQMAEAANEEVKPIIFNIFFEPLGKGNKVANSSNLHLYFQKILTDFIYIFQTYNGNLKWENICIASNISDIFLKLSKQQDSQEIAFKSLRTYQRTLPPCIKSVFFYTSLPLNQLHSADSTYLRFLKDLYQMKVMKDWDTNIIIGGGGDKGLKEIWGDIKKDFQGFIGTQMVFYKMVRRLTYALSNQKDPGDEDQNQKKGSSIVVGTM